MPIIQFFSRILNTDGLQILRSDVSPIRHRPFGFRFLSKSHRDSYISFVSTVTNGFLRRICDNPVGWHDLHSNKGSMETEVAENTNII